MTLKLTILFRIRLLDLLRIEAFLDRKAPLSAGNQKDLCSRVWSGHILEKVPVDKVYGIDLSEKMMSLARKRLENKGELKKCNA